MLKIAKRYEVRLKHIYSYLKETLTKSYRCYLFGSYAKRYIKEESDIDLLILLEEEMEPRAIKEMRIQIKSDYEEMIGYAYEIDVKVYTVKRFEELSARPGFEQAIKAYMIPLEEVCYE